MSSQREATEESSEINPTPPTAADGGNGADQTEPKLITQPATIVTPPNPFENLEALRVPQDYEGYLGDEPTSQFAVRTLREAMHLRVCPDPEQSITGVYIVDRGKQGKFFVHPQFRGALGPLPRCCNLHLAVDGYGSYFLLQVKQRNPDQDENVWYETARMVAAAAMLQWVKVTKAAKDEKGERGWAFYKIKHPMFDPDWSRQKPLKDLLNSAFPDRVVDRLSHDLIREFAERGA
jgi:hypothetical protein